MKNSGAKGLNKLHTEGPQTLVATAHNLVARTTWRDATVHKLVARAAWRDATVHKLVARATWSPRFVRP
jgi:adenylate cyclase